MGTANLSLRQFVKSASQFVKSTSQFGKSLRQFVKSTSQFDKSFRQFDKLTCQPRLEHNLLNISMETILNKFVPLN